MTKAKIHYHDIGDYLSREDKLKRIAQYGSIENIDWQILEPNEHGDWIAMRNEGFENYIPIEPVKKFDLNSESWFIPYSLGLCTNRDSFCYNSSTQNLSNNLKNSIQFYNELLEKFKKEKSLNSETTFEEIIIYNSTKLNWTDTVVRDCKNGILYEFNSEDINIGLYRPYFKQKVYFNNNLNHRVYQQPKFFPNRYLKNLAICISGVGASKDFSVLITDCIPNLDCIEKSQCFPLYYYEENKNIQKGLFDDPSENGEYISRDAISDYIWHKAKTQYNATNISKEDIFYYVYGFLHSPSYREAFANDLKKMLPRLPLVDDVRDFWAFSNAGRKLAELHLNYETVPAYEGLEITGDDNSSPLGNGVYRVEKMRFPKKDQKESIHYNSQITINNIPPKAYQYVVNGKSAIEWIMERYAITVHKESQIKNDPNDWATEVENPRYILDLLLSIISVSVQTVDIVYGLPKIEMKENDKE
jgi:predicted helicase